MNEVVSGRPYAGPMHLLLCSAIMAHHERMHMAHDYTEIDSAIIARVAEGCVTFTALSAAVSKYHEALAKTDRAPGWRIVGRRLQALRKAGRIRYQRKPEGWVLGEVRMFGAV